MSLSLSSEDVVRILSEFGGIDSLSRSHVTVQKHSGCRVNSVFMVTIDDKAINNIATHLPQKFVIRFTGGSVSSDNRILNLYREETQESEVIVSHALASIGLAPALFIILPGGRVEEWIDCRPVTLSDMQDPSVLYDLARNLAQFHCTPDLPLPKPAYRFSDQLQRQWTMLRVNYESIRMMDQALPSASDLDHDISWLIPCLHPDRHVMVLMHWDCNFNNIFIRTSRDEDQLSTIMLDYEYTCYNMRGKDLGLLLVSMGGILSPSEFAFMSNFKGRTFALPEDHVVRSFLSHYLDQVSVLDPHRASDSVDKLMSESLIGAVVSCMCYTFALIDSFPAAGRMEQITHTLKMRSLLLCSRQCIQKYVFLSQEASNKIIQ